MSAHALLAPSSSERWLTCPASVQMASKVIEVEGEETSEYAREGTDAHTIAALAVAIRFGLISPDEYLEQSVKWANETPVDEHADMLRYADLYADHVVGIVGDTGAQVFIEQRVDTGVPYCWGTADIIVVGPGWIHVVDYKYGRGIVVNAVDNPQLKLYSLGALDTFGIVGDTDVVHMTIFQPRLGLTSTWSIEADELRQWRREIAIPGANRALGEDPHFRPSLTACRFCPAAGECKPRMLHFARLDFGDPDLLTPEELAEALGQIEHMRSWCNAVEATCLSKAYNDGIELPGWKVVLSGGKRTIPDPEAAIQVLIDAGYPAEQTARVSMKTLTDLERLVGKRELPEILGDLLVKTEGRPSLVPEDDKRPAIDRIAEARRDFA